ncbi:MAG: hypothetical protein P794_01525 [Epsilonproteobacteria bacterium (ex Lamellibrachia satsuma)]|nr:MAG: hypothetical protein P794_01525 [Epsilonproteobacteria bacterium (ex Lamellibrachia satsuma)]
MAINLQDFKPTKYPNLYKSIKSHEKNGFKYLLWAKIDGKLHKKILGYSKKDNLTDRSANLKAAAYKQEVEEGYTPTKTIKLDALSKLYFESLKDTDWCDTKKNIYNRYLGTYKEENKKPKKVTRRPTEEEQKRQKIFDKNKIGHRSLDSIKEMHIEKILREMHKQGLKPRTQKTIIEVLKPMFNFAVKNKIIRDNPTLGITVKVPSQKKIVTNATDLFKKVYAGINAYYHDNPYYKALFLFGFTGRRKGEILSLKWENIDFTHNYYWIEDTKTDDQQKYQLPPYIIEPLQEIKDDRKGLVFKSPITGKKIINIDRQMRQLKKFLELDTLSMHYMRNILVSALAEQQVEAITLSGILGHKDPNTINKYLSINHYKSSQIGLNKVDEIIDVEAE